MQQFFRIYKIPNLRRYISTIDTIYYRGRKCYLNSTQDFNITKYLWDSELFYLNKYYKDIS